MQIEFQNQNTYRNYPFKETAGRIAVGDGFTLSTEVIVDFIVYGVDPERTYYLARTEWYASQKRVTLVFQDDLGNGYATVTVLSYTLDSKVVYGVYSFSSADGLVKGRVVVNRTAVHNLWGGMTFDTVNVYPYQMTEFEPGVIVPPEIAVLSINQYGYTRFYSGGVRLKEGHNISLEQDSEGITITAAQNAGKGPVCAEKQICYAQVDPDKNGTNAKLCGLNKAVMRLGGAVAGPNCEIIFAGNECIRVLKYPNEHMIAFHNECTEICNEAVLFAELKCRLCRLQAAAGIIASSCEGECADAPPEDEWHYLSKGI
jgi:hypothetical protein